jgi:acyl carrier protein
MDELEKIVRTCLPYLGADDPLPGDAELPRLGLDSMATVTLLLELEDTLGVEFPDALLVPETFATVRSLRAVCESLGARL